MNYSKGDIVVFPYPFTDLSSKKVRPAIVVGIEKGFHSDVFVVPLTSKTQSLNDGEFILTDWQKAGLNVVSAVKRGCLLIDTSKILVKVGRLSEDDLLKINNSLKHWLDL